MIATIFWAACLVAEPTGDAARAPISVEDRLRELEAKVAAQEQALADERQLNASQLGEPEADAESKQLLRIYGFADAGVQQLRPRLTSALNGITQSRAATFVLGNLNLYFDAQPSSDWRALIEVRLTNYPHGLAVVCPVPQPVCPRQSSEGYDITSSSGGWSKIRWGSLIIERAHLEWRYSDALELRVGTFLTPFGIWNLDHGTPTLISLILPQFETNELFPIRQTGVMALGRRHLGGWELGYYAYLSNGRSPTLVDFTNDKMVGGRVYLGSALPPRFTFGLSFLTGRYSDWVLDRNIPPFPRKEVVAYYEHALGADMALDVRALRLRWEVAARRVSYEDGKRESHFGQIGLYNPDRLEWDTYFLAAYQLPFWRLEPFAYLEVYRYPTFLSEGIVSPSAGFNVYFRPYAQLKVQYMYGHLTSLPEVFSGPFTQDFQLTSARLVLAF